jgi:hypothetical protein
MSPFAWLCERAAEGVDDFGHLRLPLPRDCRYKVPPGRRGSLAGGMGGGIMDDRLAHGLGSFQPLRLRLQPGDHVVDLTQPDVLLGRQSDADLRMPQPDVSRHHCRFQFTDDGWQVVDLNSLNGVFVNGSRVRRLAVIQPGDRIRICGVEMNVEYAESGEAKMPAEMLRTIAAALPIPTAESRAA